MSVSSISNQATQYLVDLQQRIPVVGDKALVDLVNGLDVSRDLIRYRNGRSFLRRLTDKLGGKDEKLQSLLDTNLVVGQTALHQWMLELCDSLRISQVALQATQESLLETRNAIRRQHERVQLQESRLQALYQHLEQLSAQMHDRFNQIEERIGRVELRVAAKDDFDRILSAWTSEQTYRKLPWAVQITLLIREVFSSTVIAYELKSGDTMLFRELLINRIIEASRHMPKSFFGLADLLEQTWAGIPEADQDLVAGLLEIRFIPQSRLQRTPYLFTIGTTLELATLSSSIRPAKPAKCAIELCRNQIDDVPAVTDTRQLVGQLVQETANDCLSIMTGSTYL
ncbi:MAG: hypothetical protein Kow00121_12560 [Elainellaceae cyanobacterium]